MSVKYILYIHFMVLCALLGNSTSIEEWLAATTCVKYCILRKLLPAINYKVKKCFSGTTTILWITDFSYESLLIILLRFLYTCQ